MALKSYRVSFEICETQQPLLSRVIAELKNRGGIVPVVEELPSVPSVPKFVVTNKTAFNLDVSVLYLDSSTLTITIGDT
jgi:hypothetical protein